MGAYRHIIWDWNGTLFDDVGLCLAIENEILARLGRPALSLARYQDCFDIPIRRFYENIGLSFDGEEPTFEDVMTAFWDAYGDRHQRECSLHDNVVALLSACAEAGLTHSLLSSLPQQELSAAVERLGLAGRFVHVSGHGDYHAGSKLDRGHALMAELGLDRDAVVLVGDTTHDFDVAAALGVDALLVASGHQSVARLRGKTDAVLASMEALEEHLRRQLSA